MDTEMLDLKKQQNTIPDSHNGSGGKAAAEAAPKKIDPWSEEALAKLPRHVRTKERAPVPDDKRIGLKALFMFEFWSWWQWLFANIPGRLGWFIRPIVYRPFFKHIGKHAHIADGVLIRYPEGIEMGDFSVMSRGVIVNGLGGLKIGSYGGLGPYTIIDTVTHNGFDHERLGVFAGMEAAPVVTGESVWIGAGTYIGPGITIGDGAFIGSSSVVTRDIPPYIVCAGAPAKPLAHRRPPSGQKPTIEADLADGKRGIFSLHRHNGHSRK